MEISGHFRRSSTAVASALFFLTLTCPRLSLACETTNVVINGNLDSRVSVSEAGYPLLTAPVTEQVLAAQAFASFQAFDSLGQAHSFAAAFYKTSDSVWANRILVTDNSLGVAPSVPPATGDNFIIFDDQGQREVIPPFDLVLAYQWAMGGVSRGIAITFEVSNLPQATELSITTDGSAAGCPQFGGLDFDGDGRDDFAIWRPGTGMWAILKSSIENGDLLWKQWGLPGDYPMPGDYTGDGKADLVVWRPSNGNWYVCKSDLDFDCSQPTVVQFGLPGDEPIKGDYDGDRIRDFAVWRRSTGTFFFRSSVNTAVTERQWGLPGDIPLQAGRNR